MSLYFKSLYPVLNNIEDVCLFKITCTIFFSIFLKNWKKSLICCVVKTTTYIVLSNSLLSKGQHLHWASQVGSLHIVRTFFWCASMHGRAEAPLPSLFLSSLHIHGAKKSFGAVWARTMQKVPLLFMGPVSRADSVAGPQKNKGTEFSACSVFRGGYLELTAEVAIFISLFSDPARPKPKGASLRNWEPGKMGMWIWPQDINRRNTADGGWITPYTFSLKSSW